MALSVSFKSIAQNKKPNVIFILADQWRADAVGYAGNPDVITPNLDKLAKESFVFEKYPSDQPHIASGFLNA